MTDRLMVFVPGAKYRAMRDVVGRPEGFVAGEVLTFVSAGYSRDDDSYVYQFRSDADGKLKSWLLHRGGPADSGSDEFEPLDPVPVRPPPLPTPLPASGPIAISWKRVFLYTLVLFLATFFAGCFGGIVGGAYEAAGETSSVLPMVLRATLVPLSVVAVFVWLGRTEGTQTAAHAAVVWVNGVLITFVLNVVLLRMSIFSFVVAVFVMSFCGVLGTGIGVLTRKNRAGPSAR